MFTALSQPTQANSFITLSLQKSSILKPQAYTLPPFPLSSSEGDRTDKLSISKPLHLSSATYITSSSCSNPFIRHRKPTTVCNAYEANRAQPLDTNIKLPFVESETAQKLKIGIYFATWWALNVVFNIYNKKVLNAFPYPWLTSTLSLAAGSLMMLISWATRIADPPKTDLEFWKALLPVAVAHTTGHVAATVSMSKVAVSFTHIIKSGEPAFSVLVSRFMLGETFPLPVYLSLLPIIGGCALSAVTELNFNMIGFMGAMISNMAFVFRNIFSKKGMNGKSVSGMNYYACLSMLSLLLLTPFAIAVEGPQVWAAGWQRALSDIGPHFVWWVAAQSIFYHLYNQVSYMSLDQISPLTFSVGNTMKRISVIVSSIIIFHTPVQPVNALGAAIAILGTFLYSQFKIALCQLTVTSNKATNLTRARHMIEEAAQKAAELVVLPLEFYDGNLLVILSSRKDKPIEMWVCPYSDYYFAKCAEDLNVKSSSPAFSMLAEVARSCRITITEGSLPEESNGRLYNACCVFGPEGKLIAKHQKLHLFDYHVPGDTFRELDTFTAGDCPNIVKADVGLIGLGLCHEIRFPELSVSYKSRAFNMSTGEALWELQARARAIDNQLLVHHHELLPDPTQYGVIPFLLVRMVTAGPEETIVIAEIDYFENERPRQMFPSQQQRNEALYQFIDRH